MATVATFPLEKNSVYEIWYPAYNWKEEFRKERYLISEVEKYQYGHTYFAICPSPRRGIHDRYDCFKYLGDANYRHESLRNMVVLKLDFEEAREWVDNNLNGWSKRQVFGLPPKLFPLKNGDLEAYLFN